MAPYLIKFQSLLTVIKFYEIGLKNYNIEKKSNKICRNKKKVLTLHRKREE